MLLQDYTRLKKHKKIIEIINSNKSEDNKKRIITKEIDSLVKHPSHYPSLIYLKESEGLAKSVADLNEIYSYPKGFDEYFLRKRILSLDQTWLEYLQYKISYFFGRAALPDFHWCNEEEKRILNQSE